MGVFCSLFSVIDRVGIYLGERRLSVWLCMRRGISVYKICIKRVFCPAMSLKGAVYVGKR